MLEKEKFNGRVVIFPLLEIELLKINVNLKKAEVLVFTSVYALEKMSIELKNFEKPVFAVGQRCNELLKEIGATNPFIFPDVKQLLVRLKDYCGNNKPLVYYLRGNEISYDLKAELLKHNINCKEYVVYKQKRSFQQEQLDKILGRKNLKGIALFSEKSVESLLKSYAGQNLDKTFFCFSKKIENKLKSVLDSNIRCKTIKEPMISDMVNMIIKEYS